MSESPSNHHLSSDSNAETVQNLEHILNETEVASVPLVNSVEMVPVADMSAAETAKSQTVKQRQIIFRSLRLVLCCGVLAGLGWAVLRQQTTLTSQQGFINGSVVSVPAPIAGDLQLEPLKPGSPIQLGQNLGQVANSRNPQLEIDRQRLRSKLDALETKLQSLQSKQGDRVARWQQFRDDRGQQRSLSVTVDNSRINRIQVEIEQSRQAIDVAKREADRLTSLAASGAIARMQADKATDEVRTAQLRLEAKQTELAQAKTEQVAAQAGLQLDGAQNLNQAELRSRELQDDLAAQVLAEIGQVNQELLTLNQQLNLQKFARVAAPVEGVVWSVQNQVGAGKAVSSNESLLQVLDCKQTWVDTFVSERELQHLKIGDPVTIKMLSQQDQQFTGRIRSIRAGVGRVAPGAEVAVPPPQQSQRQVGIQISWETNPSITRQAAQFCGVGQSVEVAFQKNNQKETQVGFQLRR
jgi:multidrug resistance efflux pump